MNTFLIKQRGRLLWAVVILFLLEVLTFPLVLSMTWAGRSENPEHTLTYTRGKLTWDSATSVDSLGVAELSLFEAVYPNVKSDNGDKVVAPGTDGITIVRLKNSAEDSVTYTAVLFEIKTSEELPIHASLYGTSFSDTEKYPLPEGVYEHQVLRAVSGSIASGSIQDFDINWFWKFEYGTVQTDALDTLLGDRAAMGGAENITVGLYITVEDGNQYITPNIPQTGDSAMIGVYIILIFISAQAIILLLICILIKEEENEDV